MSSTAIKKRRRRPFADQRALDPRRCNIGHDANALDRDGTPNDQLIDRFLRLADAGDLTVVVAGGVRAEIQHPHTPHDIKNAVLPRIFNLRPGLNSAQQAELYVDDDRGNPTNGVELRDLSPAGARGKMRE